MRPLYYAHSFVYYSISKKVTIMLNNQNQYNMNNVQFTPEGQLKASGVTFNVKAQLGRPVNPNSARQQRLAQAPGRKTGRPRLTPPAARRASKSANRSWRSLVALTGRPRLIEPPFAMRFASSSAKRCWRTLFTLIGRPVLRPGTCAKRC